MVYFNAISFIFVFTFLKSFNCWLPPNYVMFHNLNNDTIFYNAETYLELKLGAIFPGTNWCGAGSIADKYDDLGYNKKEDMCCRDHDFCPDIIPAYGVKHNLTNISLFTRENCACDTKFLKCLRAVKTFTANIIGDLYFNSIRTQCYRYDYPAECKETNIVDGRCLNYEFNTNAEKIYQWFDEPIYRWSV